MTRYRSESMNHVEENFFFLEGTGQHIQTLYRGQRMSARELAQLEVCVGATIAMISFVSTTKNLDVAKVFAGNRDEQPDIESLIFEIIIDECKHEYQRSPYADISALSWNRDEDEVLLCPGTTLHVESVERKGPVAWVLVRMCQREDNKLAQQLTSGFDIFMGVDSVLDEVVALFKLGIVLYFSNNSGKLEQIVRAIRASMYEPVDPLISLILESLSLSAKREAEPSIAFDNLSRYIINGKKLLEHVQLLFDCPGTPKIFRDTLSAVKGFHDGIAEQMENVTLDSFCLTQFSIESLDKYPELTKFKEHPGWQLFLRKKIQPFLEERKLNDQSHGPTIDNTLQLYHDATFSEQDHDRITWCSDLAEIAREQGNDEEAIRLLREGLAIPCSRAQPRIFSYIRLQLIYIRQKNWVAVIECCQDLINMPQLPPKSRHIVEAYMLCGYACRELKDYSEALVSYTKALELQHQHHPPRHSRAAEIYVAMGILFFAVGDADTAIEYLQSAIALDFPESTSKAYEWIARTYTRMKHYDEARSHLFQCLDIRQHHFPSNTVQLVETYLLLIRIEHITGNHQQRDLYIQHARRVADSSEKARNLLQEETQSFQ